MTMTSACVIFDRFPATHYNTSQIIPPEENVIVNKKRTYLPTSPTCFVCGEHNHAGLQGTFYVEDDAVFMPLNIKDHHCGYPNVVHGGIVAAALDECMAWAATRAVGRMCVTGKLTVRYLDRTPAITGLLVKAVVTKSNRMLAYAEATLTDDTGKEYARAEGSFMPVSAEETIAVDDGLIYKGNEERVFDYLRDTPEISEQKE